MLQLDGTGPLHQQIYRAFRNEILSGVLAPGERVPSTRALADLLKVSRNTAVSAYEQLLAEGYLETRLGAAGTVVAPVLPPERLALRPSAPPSLQRPPSRRAGARLAIAGERILKTARAGARSLGLPTLTWELREAIATRLRRLRGVDASPERIVIVNGTQQALDLISRVLLNPGDRVLMEDPHYTGPLCAFMSAGAELVPSPVDDHGIRVPKPTTGRRPIRLAYVTPSHQFPTGVVLPILRRLELLDWASRVGAFIVEDDYDSEYRYDGPPLQALTGLDREDRAIYLGTFSKILFPALRLAYLVLPESLVEPVMAAKAIGDTGTATLEQLALADFISMGHFDRHLRRTNVSNAARRNALVAAVHKEFAERAEVCGANAGLHLLVWLKARSGGMIKDVVRKAEKAGVGLYTVDPFYIKPPRRTGVVLGYAPLCEREIREGIRRLAEALT